MSKNGTNGKNGALKVESGIPIPIGFARRKGYAALIRTMKVGDSLFLPSRTSQAAYQAGAQIWGAGAISTRRENDGYRLWRIK